MKREVMVIAELMPGQLTPASLELAGFARKLAEAAGGEALGIVLSSPGTTIAEDFAAESGLPTLALLSESLALYNAESYLAVLAPLILQRKPRYVVIAHSPVGWDFAPRLAAKVNGSCISGVVGFKHAPICVVRPIFGGKMLEEVLPLGEGPAVLTVMPGAAKAIVAEKAGEVTRIQVEVENGVTRTLGYREGPRRTLDLGQAEVIVAAGRGIGGPENLHLVRELAACFEKSAVAASRPVVDYGWLPLEHQVGMTGQTVAPGLYLACGISGAQQHLMGMNQSRRIVAINTDPNAPIFQFAHLGVCADLLEFLPVLIRKLREAKSGK